MKLEMDYTHKLYLVAENIQDKVWIHNFCKTASKDFNAFTNIDFKKDNGTSGMSHWEEYEWTEEKDALHDIEEIESLEIQNVNI